MTKARPSGCAWQLIAALIASTTATAQVVMPPANMGSSSFIDGVAGPGLLVQPIVMEHYHAGRFADSKGATIAGQNSINSWSSLFHVAYLTTHQVLGGFYGVEFLLPVASVDIKTGFGPNGQQSGFGDLLVSPLIIEWPGRTLFGKPYFSRFAALAVLPTGSYSATRSVNIGSNAGGAFAYYAFTYFPQPRLETSWRIHYLWNAKNSAPFVPLKANTTQAGQAIHANYAMSYELSPSLRIGANGYFFQQISDHRLDNSPLVNSKERVLAFGPGAMWSSGFWSLFANVDLEMLARNRPEGYRVNVTLRRIFPHSPPSSPPASSLP